MFEQTTDFPHIYLTCSNCNAGLVDIVLTVPNPELACMVQASCPWCGDESFQKEVPGAFARDGFTEPKEGEEDDPDAYWESTVIAEEEMREDVLYFTTVKAKPNARPVHVR